MKKTSIIFLLITFLFAACSGIMKKGSKSAEVKTLQDSISYCLGISVGEFAKNYDMELNMAVLEKAMNDLLDEGDLVFQKEEINMIMQVGLEKLSREMGAKNKEEGEKFLEENKTKSGIVTTQSGLQYEILKEGNGPKPIEGDIVSVHYIGSFIDGTEFNNSYESPGGQPVEFPMREGMIKGWLEGMKLMPLGSKWKIYMPSELAYGEDPPPSSGIKPNSVLIFEVELLDIKPEEQE